MWLAKDGRSALAGEHKEKATKSAARFPMNAYIHNPGQRVDSAKAYFLQHLSFGAFLPLTSSEALSTDPAEDIPIQRRSGKMRMWRHLLVAAWAGVAVCIFQVRTGWADCPQFDDPVQIGSVQSVAVTEASGMVASRKNPGVLWVHNDSGDSARVFAMGMDGANLGTFNIVGITARDWEDIALGPGPVAGEDYLYIGDIGDNNGVYSSIVVQRVLEPSVGPGGGTVDVYGVESIELVYPASEKMDAETLLIDPVNGDLYIISKREIPCRIFRAAYPQSTATTTTLEYLGQLAMPRGYGWAVGGDISPSGDRIIVRGGIRYGSIYFQYQAAFWARPEGATVADVLTSTGCLVPLAYEPQGEAICFNQYGCGYFTVSEGASQRVYSYRRAWAGDLDEDCDVDLSDYAVFAECMSTGTVTGDCTIADADGDDDIDIVDFTAFARGWLSVAEP